MVVFYITAGGGGVKFFVAVLGLFSMYSVSMGFVLTTNSTVLVYGTTSESIVTALGVQPMR